MPYITCFPTDFVSTNGIIETRSGGKIESLLDSYWLKLSDLRHTCIRHNKDHVPGQSTGGFQAPSGVHLETLISES